MKTNVDLPALAGSRYRTDKDPAGKGCRCDPWLIIVPCQFGHIFVRGVNTLGVWVNGSRRAGRFGREFPWLRLVQDGGNEVIFECEADHFNKIAKVMKAYRKRTLTADQRAKATDRLKRYREGRAA